MKPIIEIENLSKKFMIGHQQSSYLSLRDKISSAFRANSNKEEFWALSDVNFSLMPGESMGIIGRNGAGKSTLLKVLSRITPPSKGKIITRGRIASLLEVGTGFHPELTGRENIFMNGSIIGMRNLEIKARFDEIVDFSGTEKFLDTPLKHYSSGMQLRLAFAVAAHLEPEILIIDEVLAVGDAEFQKKCLAKMEDVTGQGRTILFVSHNLGVMKSLCKRGLLLENGRVNMTGTAHDVVNFYLQKSLSKDGIFQYKKPSGNAPGYANSLTILNDTGKPCSSIPLFKAFTLLFKFTITDETKHFIIGIGMTTLEDSAVRTVWSKPLDIKPGTYEGFFKESNIFFATGKFKIIIGLSSREQPFQYIPDAGIIEFDDTKNKDVILNNSLGVLLNPMNIEIHKCEDV